MERSAFAAWLDRYVAAWKSYDAQGIGDLFSVDAEYRYHPNDEPERGREAIVATWLDDKDEPGRFDAAYEPLAIDGDIHVAQGWSRYFDASGDLADEYWNIYVCRFDDEGRCREFIEYWIRNRDFARRDREAAAAPASSGEVDEAAGSGGSGASQTPTGSPPEAPVGG